MSFAALVPPPFAVHLSDGVLNDPVWIGGFAATAVLVMISAAGVREEEIPRIGVLTAAFFVASLVYLPLGPTRAHLLLNGLLGVVLGLRAGVAIAVGLALQALLFAHGGLTALGVNVCIYAWPAMLAGVLFRPVRRLRLLPDFPLGMAFGAATAAATVALNYLALRYGGIEDWKVLSWAILAAHVPLIAVEAVGVGFAVRYLGKVKPEWLQ